MDSIKKIINQVEVAYSRALLDAAYSLTRDQKRILWMFLMDLDKDLGVDVDSELGVLTFKLKSYVSLFNLDAHEASRDVLQALSDFNSREVRIYLEEESTKKEAAIDELSWLAKKSYRPKRGTYIVYFNPYLVPYLKGMTPAVNGKFIELDKFKNPKHGRLYTKLHEAEPEKTIGIDIDWIIERYELPETYKRYSNFKQRFLSPAIESIKQIKGMENLKYTELKESKKVVKIIFDWSI